jgi:hypothetical protein
VGIEKERKMITKLNEEAVEVTVIPDFSKPSVRAYSNYLHIMHDEHGFVFTFCENQFERIVSPESLQKDAAGKYILKIPVVAQIIIPPTLMPKILEAIKTNYDRFIIKIKKDIDGPTQG